ncbi:MAG TPA: hypothetical protein VGL99_21905 [Chloroflexota bacterium]
MPHEALDQEVLHAEAAAHLIIPRCTGHWAILDPADWSAAFGLGTALYHQRGQRRRQILNRARWPVSRTAAQ